MENIGMIISLSILGILLFYLVTGFLLGIIRGVIKSAVRLAWLVLCMVIALIFSRMLLSSVLKMNIGFMHLEAGGREAGTLNEYVNLLLSDLLADEGVDAAALGSVINPLMDFAVSLLHVVLGGILCFPLFFLLQLITLPLYWILNKILSLGKKSKKHRIAGGLVGLFSGLLVFVMTLMPVTGYVTAVQNTLSGMDFAGDEEAESVIGDINTVCDAYYDSPVMQGLKVFGIDKLQLGLFRSLTTSKVKVPESDKSIKISLLNETKNAGRIATGILYVTGLQEGEPLDEEKLSDAVSAILGSDIVKSVFAVAKPVASVLIEEKLPEEAEEYKEIISKAAEELLDGLINIDEDKINTGIKAAFDIRDEYTKFADSGNDPESVDFKAIGSKIDDIISTGLVTKETVSKAAGILTDMISERFEGGEEPSAISGAITEIAGDIKEGFIGGVDSFKTEFGAVGCLAGVMSYVSDENFDLEKDGVKIGEKIDLAIAENAKVINEKLISKLAVAAIDSFCEEGVDEDNVLHGSIGKIKEKIQEGGLTYSTEFGAISKLWGLKDNLSDGLDFEADGALIGRTVDEVIAMGSKIVTKDFVNCFIKDGIDMTFDEENEFTDTVGRIKDKINTDIESYETEFNAIAKMVSVKDRACGAEFDLRKDGEYIGGCIDEALAFKAHVVDKSLINSFIKDAVKDGDYMLGDYGSMEEIKARLDMEFSYKEEFNYLSQLLYISDHAAALSIETINSPQIWEGETEGKTFGERLDGIAPSVLVGDMGLMAMDKALDGYAKDEECKKFESITGEVIENYKAIITEKRAKVCGRTKGCTYVKLVGALDGMYLAVSNSEHKITGKDDFNVEIAKTYEETLNELQDNIVVGSNGARALSAYVAEEVKEFVGNKKTGVGFVDDAIDGLEDYIGRYVKYMNGRIKSPEEELYDGETDKFAVSLSGEFKDDVEFKDAIPEDGNFVRVNRPFSYVIDKLLEIFE